MSIKWIVKPRSRERRNPRAAISSGFKHMLRDCRAFPTPRPSPDAGRLLWKRRSQPARDQRQGRTTFVTFARLLATRRVLVPGGVS